ncbi:MAG: DUF6089 family protein [Bacteroidia bacterium]|nr:DUF6089 family protein [Bacteroidia bacterium]
MINYHLKYFLLFITFLSFSQNFYRPGEWKRYRNEYFLYLGSSHFLGDLGGRDREGTDYSPVDLDWNQTRSALGLGYRYKIQNWLNFSTAFQYLILKGDDKETKDPFRRNRNLNFKSNVFDLSARIELGFNAIKAGNRYGIKKTLLRRYKNRTWSLFFYSGIGAFYFNPKGRDFRGNWVNLYPLHTEGQGLPGGPKQYKRFAISMPFGAFYRIVFNRKWSFGIDICWTKTFTDYLDDVSGGYYNKDSIRKYYGDLAAYMSDPHLGLIPGHNAPDASGNPGQRGDNEKDSYITIKFTFGYVIKKTRRRTARLKSKF